MHALEHTLVTSEDYGGARVIPNEHQSVVI